MTDQPQVRNLARAISGPFCAPVFREPSSVSFQDNPAEFVRVCSGHPPLLKRIILSDLSDDRQRTKMKIALLSGADQYKDVHRLIVSRKVNPTLSAGYQHLKGMLTRKEYVGNSKSWRQDSAAPGFTLYQKPRERLPVYLGTDREDTGGSVNFPFYWSVQC